MVQIQPALFPGIDNTEKSFFKSNLDKIGGVAVADDEAVDVNLVEMLENV